MNTIVGGAIIGRGSFGCVFKPSLPCPGDKGGGEDMVSKVFFSEDSKKEAKAEMEIDAKIRNIKGHEQWAHIWYKKCRPAMYATLYKEDPEIEDCLDGNDISEDNFDKYRHMLQGTYAGISLLEVMSKAFTASSFTDRTKFTVKFLHIMKSMKPLFIGLNALYTNKLTHIDIKDENIVVRDGLCTYIDFGLACEFKDKQYYRLRSKKEFIHDRIYPPYPYEYIYLYTPPELLKETDKADTAVGINRSLHDRYLLVHEQMFSRKVKPYLDNLIERFIKNGKTIRKKQENDIISLIDTYSLGMLIPCILGKLSKKYRKMKQLKKLLALPKIKSFIDLFKHMTEPDNYDRMKPNDAYDKYCELEKLYLNKKDTKKRTRRK